MSQHLVPRHVKSQIIVGRGTHSHSVGITTPSGAFIQSNAVGYGGSVRWDVYTASGELVRGGYPHHELHLAVAHACAITGNQEDMGCWDGPTVIFDAPVYAHADLALRLWLALSVHPQALANEDFTL